MCIICGLVACANCAPGAGAGPSSALYGMSAELDQDPTELWKQALQHLQRQVSPANYDNWLSGTEGLRLTNDVLVIGTRSEFVTEWLQILTAILPPTTARPRDLPSFTTTAS